MITRIKLKRLANFWFSKKDLKEVISYGQTGDPSRNNCNKKLRKRNKNIYNKLTVSKLWFPAK